MKTRSEYLQAHTNLGDAFVACHAELQQARRTIAHLRRGLGCGCETLEYVVPPDVPTGVADANDASYDELCVASDMLDRYQAGLRSMPRCRDDRDQT